MGMRRPAAQAPGRRRCRPPPASRRAACPAHPCMLFRQILPCQKPRLCVFHELSGPMPCGQDASLLVSEALAALPAGRASLQALAGLLRGVWRDIG